MQRMNTRAASETPSFSVIEAVANREGVSEGDLPPLPNVVNPEALNRLFAPRLDGRERRGGRVQFEYCGYTVVIDADDTVNIED